MQTVINATFGLSLFSVGLEFMAVHCGMPVHKQWRKLTTGMLRSPGWYRILARLEKTEVSHV